MVGVNPIISIKNFYLKGSNVSNKREKSSEWIKNRNRKTSPNYL